MIKKIRIFKFASDCTLKPRQRDLVNFFDDYKLSSGDNNDEKIQLAETSTRPISRMIDYAQSSSKVSDKTSSDLGRRGSDVKNLEDALRNQVAMGRIVDAIEGFDPNINEKDKAIYTRIMRENYNDDSLESSNRAALRSERTFNMK